MTRSKRWRTVGWVWAISITFAGCWTCTIYPYFYFKNKFEAKRRGDAIDEDGRRRMEADRRKKYSEEMQAAVRRGPPDLVYKLGPGEMTPWIETWRNEESKRSITFDFGGLSNRAYVEWDDNRKEVIDCTVYCSIPGYPHRIRFENTDPRPGEFRLWYF